MNSEDIIRMAREAGFRIGNYTLSSGDPCVFAAPVSATDCILELKRFAALVAAAERESCIEACMESYQDNTGPDGWIKFAIEAIRSRSTNDA